MNKDSNIENNKKAAALATKELKSLIEQTPEISLLAQSKSLPFEQKAQLLELIPNGKIQKILDLDCWQAANFLPKNFNNWMDTMSSIDLDKLGELFFSLDQELLITGFLNEFIVLDYDMEEPPPPVVEDRLLITVDFKYALIFNKPNLPLKSTFQKLFNKLAAFDLKKLNNILLSTRSEQISSVNEQAIKYKNIRLQEMGFMEHSESINLYSPGSPTAKKTQLTNNPINKFSPKNNQVNKPNTLPTVQWNFDQSNLFIHQCINGLENIDQKNQLIQECYHIINASLIADEHIQSDKETIQSVCLRSIHYINLGLNYLANNNIQAGQNHLKTQSVFSLYNLGWLLIFNLNKMAAHIRSFKSFLPETDQQILTIFQGRHLNIEIDQQQQLELEIKDEFISSLYLPNTLKLANILQAKMATLELLREKYKQDWDFKNNPLSINENIFQRLVAGFFHQAAGLDFSPLPINKAQWDKIMITFNLTKFKNIVTDEISQCPDSCCPYFKNTLEEYANELVEYVDINKEFPDKNYFSALSIKN